ncbi:filamentous hemagglutinin N-terminal domain-containing protein [Aliarcobacter cryaerophilus]|uniref:two-partner secretion domain-containing protein n=1 Tax=Aliarcobacter cryaerophilus TaxID=28198 RepID=UPI003DA5419B
MFKLYKDKNKFYKQRDKFISLLVDSKLITTSNNGIIINGNATISKNGNTITINQISNKATINWSSFNLAKGEIVNFNQPNQKSITINMVTGNEKSIIDGVLKATGQILISNNKGVLFGKNAKINTHSCL